MEMSLPQVEIRRTGRAGESKELTEEPRDGVSYAEKDI